MKWALLFLCLALTGTVFADGMFFDQVGSEKTPTLPYQRALISYRNGRETLIVESMFNAPAGDYAWVVPLPSPPIHMEASTPGVLETAVLLTPPQRLLQDTGTAVPRIALIAFGMIAVAIWELFRHKDRSLSTSGILLLECLAAGSVMWLLGTVFINPRTHGDQKKGADTGGVSEGVQILQRQTLGSYDAVVIQGRDANGILSWLSSNGYRVPESAKPIVDSYTREGWCFMAAKIRHEGKGTASPHPLKVVFDTPRAVYPMRLTALSGTPLLLDLFIIGESYGIVSGLDAWSYVTQSGSVEALEDTDSLHPYNHPGLAVTMWNDAHVARLRGRMNPSSMGADLWVKWSASRPDVAPVYRPKAAVSRIVWGAIVGFALTFVLGIAAALSRPGRLSYRVVATVVLSVALSGVAGLGVAPRHVTDFEEPASDYKPSQMPTIDRAIQDLRENPAGKRFPQAFREKMIALSKSSKGRPGIVIPDRDVPGGYLVRPLGQGWVVWGIAGMMMSPSQVWLIDSQGRPETLSVKEIKNKKAELARRYGLHGEVLVDPATGEMNGYYGINGPTSGGGHLLEGEPTRKRAIDILSGWADRLGIEKSRSINKLEISYEFTVRPTRRSFSMVSVKYILDHEGYKVFDRPDIAELSADFDNKRLLYLKLRISHRIYEAPVLRLSARQAQDLALPAAKEGNLGKPLEINASKDASPGYVRPYDGFMSPEDLIECTQHLRLAWRMFFEKGWVDVDAETGKVLCIGEGKPTPN